MSTLYKKILLTLDGSAFASEAMPHAEAIAECTDAKLIVYQVVEDLTDYVVMPSEVMGAMAVSHNGEAHRQAMDAAKSYLDDLAESMRYRKINADADMDTGDPATSIIDYATENDVDLIVMSTHGRTGLARWTYGSVTNKVLQAAPCAVLVVRPASVKDRAQP